jgi:hypothetical protein
MITDSEREEFLKLCKAEGKEEDQKIGELIKTFINSKKLP